MILVCKDNNFNQIGIPIESNKQFIIEKNEIEYRNGGIFIISLGVTSRD